MEKIEPNECKHLIKGKYYCVKCGTLCYNRVSLNNINFNISLKKYSQWPQDISNILITMKSLLKPSFLK